MTFWTDEKVEALKDLAGQGLSAELIRARIGAASRSAVVGKCYRLGIQLRGDIRKSPCNNYGRRFQKKAPTSKIEVTSDKNYWKKRQFNPSGKTRVSREAPPPELEATNAGAPGIQFTDLENKHCRWPIGDPKDEDFKFCGHNKLPGSSYCPDHAEIATPGITSRLKSRQEAA